MVPHKKQFSGTKSIVHALPVIKKTFGYSSMLDTAKIVYKHKVYWNKTSFTWSQPKTNLSYCL